MRWCASVKNRIPLGLEPSVPCQGSEKQVSIENTFCGNLMAEDIFGKELKCEGDCDLAIHRSISQNAGCDITLKCVKKEDIISSSKLDEPRYLFLSFFCF